MSIFDRFRSKQQPSAQQTSDGQRVPISETGNSKDQGQEATRLIEEGHVLEAEGKLDEAILRYLEAAKIAPNPARAHLNHGNALLLKGDLQRALEAFKIAIRHKPDYAGAYFNIGKALFGNKQFDDAIDSYRHALEIQPDYAEAYTSLGVSLKEIGKFDDAVSSHHRALELNPNLAEAHSNLGIALQALGQLESAVACHRRSLEINPHSAEAHSNLGLALKELGQYENAETSYRKALAINPHLATAQWNLSLLLLPQGRYLEAWPLYEARYDPSSPERYAFPPDLPFPQWHGEPLIGKSLLIWPEQGMGDEIQFARYIPMLKQSGVSRITLVCKSPLVRLLKTVDGVDVVISESDKESLPQHDYWTFPLSLPLHFATTIETIPSKIPYLSALPEWQARWHKQLTSGKLKVGLVWKGNKLHKNDANRSLPSIASLAPLWSVPDVTFISLQKGAGEEEGATPPIDQPLLHLGSDISDFADSAAIVAQLDLVICIDTAIAHLSGALNKPCWVLLPAIGLDWRWLYDRSDSPWYPGAMRLFRQQTTEDWASTIEAVTQELKELAVENNC